MVIKPSLRNCRVLVVEDDYMIADDMQRALEDEGAVVLGPVPSVLKALRVLDIELHVDGAVLDVNLGSEQVFPVADALQMRGIPFLFTTGYNAADIPASWRHIPRLEKPVQMTTVVRALLAGGTP